VLSRSGGPTVIYTTAPPNFTIDGLGGDDKLIVDYTNGDPLPAGTGGFSLKFDGGGPGDNDSLIIKNSNQNAKYKPNAALNSTEGGHDGTIVMTDALLNMRTIQFYSLSPIDFDMATGGSVELDTPSATNVVTVDDGVLSSDASKDALVVSGTSGGVGFETAYIRNAAVTIDTTAVNGNDTITINHVSSRVTGAHTNDDLISALTISAGNQAGDVIKVNGVVNANGTTTLNATKINLDANILGAVAGNTATTVNVNQNP